MTRPGEHADFLRSLATFDVSEPAYSVLFHVADTVVVGRAFLAAYAAQNLPNCVRPDITEAECLDAIEQLVARGVLDELSAEDIEDDRARWQREVRPVSWGVDRDRRVGDIDLSQAGFDLMQALAGAEPPGVRGSPKVGYQIVSPTLVRVLGETEQSCHQQVRRVLDGLGCHPFAFASRAEPGAMTPCGAWWYARFDLVSSGFEVLVTLSQ